MLILLKPWRDLSNLKLASQTWEEAFKNFVDNAPPKIHAILSGIQYFHESESSAKDRPSDDGGPGDVARGSGMTVDEVDGLEMGEDVANEEEGMSEEGLANLIASQTPWREEFHGRLAVEVAKRAKIFSNDASSWDVIGHPISNATGDDLRKLHNWKTQMKGDILRQNKASDAPRYENDSGSTASVSRMQVTNQTISTQPHVSPLNEVPMLLSSEASLPPVDPSKLKSDQFRAYDIVRWHLDQTLAGKKPPPLRMLMSGEGGTGKSKVIQTVTEVFAQKGAKFMLLKAAYTGIAASIVDGKTTHKIGCFSTNSLGTLSDEAKAKLQEFWRYIRYLIIDECSMLAKTFLALLSRNITIGVAGSHNTSDHSFGGINVILCGDFHQFPPVATAASEALYQPTRANDTIDSQLGRKIYEEFTTVVILKEQMRVTDETWRDFLHHLRLGRVQEHHIRMLRTLVIGHPHSTAVDFNSEPWNNASLVTPRHAVRKLWNEAAVRKWCRKSGERLFICHAEDTIRGRALTLAERYSMATRNKTGRKKRKDLPVKIEIAKGMKVMVTSNVETDLDVANGARGEIVDIILHPDEPPIGDGPIVELKYLPAYVLVKLSRTRATQLEGLDEMVIPVEPASTTFQIRLKTQNGKSISRTVQRRQYPMTGAYGFTDYRAQGQTLLYVVVDIATPPTGSLSLFNLYVALSRSSGRFTIRLLRDFDESLFLKSHSPKLLAEDDRLEVLNTKTKAWWQRMGRESQTQE